MTAPLVFSITMKAFALISLLPFVSGAPSSTNENVPAPSAANQVAPSAANQVDPSVANQVAPSAAIQAAPNTAYQAAPYQPAPYQPAPYQPAPYQPAPYQPTPYQPAPSYGYEQPKHNCTIQDVTEIAEVCTPAFEVECLNEDLVVKKIVDQEFCYTVTRTVCSESMEEIPNEICSYTYEQKEEEHTAKTIEVAFNKETKTQMVTVCQPGYGGGYDGYGAYGNNYCKEVAQETSFNAPVVNPVNVPVTLSYPEPVKTCTNKPISLLRVTCQDLEEQKCISVPEVEEDIETVEKCVYSLGAPACQQIKLTLPKQVCVELIYGNANAPSSRYHA